MGACSPPISHLLPNPNKTLITNTTRKPFFIILSSSSKHQLTIQRRQLLLLSLPISITTIQLTCSSSSAVAAPIFDPISEPERAASLEVSRRVAEAVELLEKGREFQAQGDYVQALQYFTQYARVGRALALYEVGDKNEAISEMEDVSISLKGSPEVHAALAAALYSDKHASVLAENQFTIATLLDPKYTDLGYVKDTKHWPPSLVRSLQDFITLS
ncbi:Tetratricopeptide-like helical [Cynara cardunculus var. scolymus]|uniref:Tetratricopeptide-like helical n=1 Tax=Cynara cardunculus var. scolymus TaxID=59895 RepID=A0A103XB30_CYNCS|nr:Tetratricopeptide-like helical [Cynara cardunculus var. scolymus]